MSAKHHETRRKTARKGRDGLLGRESDVVSHSQSADSRILQERIRVTAYFLAEQRGFIPGHELDDWAAAQQLVGVSGDAPRRTLHNPTPERGAPVSKTQDSD